MHRRADKTSGGRDARSSDEITHYPGTYVLVLRADSPQRIRIGRWGALSTRRGYYLYVGSAFGPGGVNARVQRHCRDTKACRWHIDYLREVTTPVEAWCGFGSRDLEHRWAQVLGGMSGVSSMSGFGCSDCKCEAHLFASPGKPDFDRFCSVAGADVQAWPLHAVAERVKR